MAASNKSLMNRTRKRHIVLNLRALPWVSSYRLQKAPRRVRIRAAGMADPIATRSTDLLQSFLELYWFAPPVALWRAVEARAVAQQCFFAPMLDLGCGHGRFAVVIFGTHRSIAVGCDLLHYQLIAARDGGAYRTVALADGRRLPYASGTFATILANSVLEHIANPVPVLEEMARTVQIGGRLIITVPSDRFHHYLPTSRKHRATGQLGLAAAYNAAVDQQLQHYHYHTPNEWARLFQAAGLELAHEVYYMTPAATAAWDRMNQTYGIGRRSFFSILVSPRLRQLGYQRLVARLLPRLLDQRLRPYYEMDVAPGETGAGLLLVAEKTA
jgi:SAM-dependent methyltransferase